MKNIYVLEGKNIYDLDSFFKEFAKAVNAPNGYFGRNLMQFDDCLFGGYGLEAPCEIIWKNSNLSKEKLNSDMLREYYEEEKEWFEKNLIDEIKELRKNGQNPDKYDLTSLRGIRYSLEIIDKAKNGELSMFEEIVSEIESVTKRARLGWRINLKLE
ncbi:barstar family protein [Clostridium saccharobutylicum]|uniref:Barstar (Barnase inhibitor) n=1 Tax=Clostridium saccharobutylicum TaxID=169679 RepID=A0A1S8MNY1_CLOSA|nr:barstar family protein [Clostridium saccharobutylicum]OOM05884.1 barstar (barnase inhibitor) [Clostridium saccharobutylicum]